MVFKRVGGQKTYIKFAECKPEQILVEGQYIGRSPNKFGNDNFDFKPSSGGPTVCINHAGHLAWLMENHVAISDNVQVVYKGKQVLESGAYAGKSSHQFEVLVAESDLATPRPEPVAKAAEFKSVAPTSTVAPQDNSGAVDLSGLD